MIALWPIIQLALGLTTGILQNRGIIGASTDNLIMSLSGLGQTLLASFSKKNTAVTDVILALGTLQGVITTLQQTKGLTSEFMDYLSQADSDVSAGLAKYVQIGQTGFVLSDFAAVPMV